MFKMSKINGNKTLKHDLIKIYGMNGQNAVFLEDTTVNYDHAQQVV